MDQEKAFVIILGNGDPMHGALARFSGRNVYGVLIDRPGGMAKLGRDKADGLYHHNSRHRHTACICT